MASTKGECIDTRKRRVHKKSRLGCGNCKLRSIKCDETKPCCRRCKAFGVRCNYGKKLSADALATEATFKVELATTVTRSSPVPLPVSGSGGSSETYQLVPEDIHLLEKFETSTLLTLGTRSSQHNYTSKLLTLAFANPAVMHVVLGLALIHQTAFDLSRPCGIKRAANHHWHEAVSYLHRKVSQPIDPLDRDALYILAGIVNIGSFASVEAVTPAEAWPLRPASDSDLSWLKLCEGEKLVWRLTDPTRQDGMFRVAATEIDFNLALVQDTATRRIHREDLPQGLYDLFEVSAGLSNSPYYAGAVAMVEILRAELDPRNFLPHLYFISVLDSAFRTLLHQKDERAMLMLLYWYAKICDRRVWWMWRQAWTEGLATCEYLERRWAKKPDLFRLLTWPRMMLTAASIDVEE